MRNLIASSRERPLRVVLTLTALALAVPFAASAEEPAAPSGRLAKIAAAQNVVESRPAGADDWVPAAPGKELFGNDRVRTGAASRAAILYADDTLHRIDEKSEVEIVPPQSGESGLLKVLGGRHYFSSRRPTKFRRVETSTVTAAIKGTEFAVDVAQDGTTTVTMIEGVVLASNGYGSVEVGAGESAVAEPGKAPVRAVVVRPRDAVSWALYYPPVLGAKDAERIARMGEDGRALMDAAAKLGTGQVDEAGRLVAGVLERNPSEPVALSLAAVIALVGDRRDEARDLAARATSADGESAAAALAASFVAQADFDIAEAAALAGRAAELDPGSPAALARVAELRMAQGDVRGAREAARAALARSPEDPRALSVLGFVELAAMKPAEAAAHFEQALSSDSGFAEAHLGLGLARIRLRDLEGGREEIQAAVALDPSNSLLRSYLGKAYYEQRRSYEARKELDSAKDLDPSDPTPWLYSAILLQNENRPVEALDDLLASIERNDNRAVYRSRLLLDEDRAVRSTDLARIFNDLGFEEAGLVSARRSADENQANHSSHLFLAGNYRDQPFFASAFLSEVLQARIYQPLSANAARPDLVNASPASFNEYTALFDRPRLRAFGVAAYGKTNTDLSAYDTGDLCPDSDTGELVPCYTLNEIDDSRFDEGQLTVTKGGDRYAAALSYSTLSDDGFRFNADEDNGVGRGFVLVALSERDTIQLNAIRGERETGDLPLRQLLPTVFPSTEAPERIDTTETNIGLGWHRKLSAGSDFAVSAIWNETEQTGEFLDTPIRSTATLSGPQIEAQWVKRAGRATWIAGAGAFDGSVELGSGDGETLESDDTYANAYGYLKLRAFGPLEVTLGVAAEDVSSPVGLLPPRDSFIEAAELSYDKTGLSPKLGISATLSTGTTFRAGVYRRVAPFVGRLQTLEPTQVAGFNQFFEDVGGTQSWNYGVGFDQQLGRRIFFGGSWIERDLTVPEAYCDRDFPGYEFSGCAFQTPVAVEERDNDERYLRGYASGTIGNRIAVTVGYDNWDRKLETTWVAGNTALFQDRVRTERIRPEIRLFVPMGLFLRLRGTWYDQKVDQFDTIGSSDRNVVESDFRTVDAAVGYRFPKRWGSFVIEGRNLNNEKFEFYERSVQERVIPARALIARLEITY